MLSVQEWLKKSFVLGQDLPEFVPEFPVIPLCMRKDLSATEEYLLPSAMGATSGFVFYPANQTREHSKKQALVIVSHALGHHPCESMWVWIHNFLKQGIHVLAVALDGHAKAKLSLLDLRCSSRSLSLVLDRLRETSKKNEIDVFLFGHFMGATYSLLAAAREPAASFVKAVICNAPTVSAQSNFEFLAQSPPAMHPIRFLKDGTKMTTYYGLAGFRRIWSSNDSKSLRSRVATACSFESQVQLFLKESLSSPDCFAGIRMPVIWFYGERDRGKGAAQFEQLMSTCEAKVYRFSDPVRSSRGVQFSQVWPEKVSTFIAQSLDSAKGIDFDGSQLLGFEQSTATKQKGEKSENRTGESHAG
jgi:alpha-beta hydrolase superfamily lysophospholipase